MKSIFLVFLLSSIAVKSFTQNIGFGTSDPVSRMHAAAGVSDILTIENTNALAIGVRTGINFAAGLNSENSIKYAGAIRTIGNSSTEARLGFFTFASTLATGLIERMSILDNGNVGIGTTSPSYKLSVIGSAYFDTYVGIQTAPNPSYSLSVYGPSRYYSDLRIDGILNPNNALAIGNNTTIEGTLTVENGKGIVRSVSSTQMKMKRGTVGFAASGFGAGVTLESGFMNFGEDYSAVTIVVGQVVSGTGDWAKVLVVPFEVDVANNRCRFKITNVSSSTITFDADWQVVMIGN